MFIYRNIILYLLLKFLVQMLVLEQGPIPTNYGLQLIPELISKLSAKPFCNRCSKDRLQNYFIYTTNWVAHGSTGILHRW